MRIPTALQVAMREPRGSKGYDLNTVAWRIIRHRNFQKSLFEVKKALDNAAFFWYNGPDPDVPATPLAITMFGGGFDYNFTIFSDLANYGWFAARWSNNIRGPWVQLRIANVDFEFPQEKKRQWGLFVKTRNRRPKHRGPKSDLLYLRVPHR